MFFAPCTVIQHRALLKINVLIQFVLSSTCFEHLMFIIRKTILYMRPYMVLFHAFMQVG